MIDELYPLLEELAYPYSNATETSAVISPTFAFLNSLAQAIVPIAS
jgi:hypothetical protein